jgi:predicted DNA-binding transcriptional regulator YafY
MSFAKAEKLLDLATFAASRRQGVTLDDIIARYDISLRTAQRMLKALELRFPNAEFWYDDEGKKRCRLPGGQLRELFAVTANELSAIDLSLSHLERAGFALEAKALETLRDKVLALVPSQNLARLEPDCDAILEAQGFVARPGPRPRVNEAIAASILEAIKGCRLIDISYRSRFEDEPALRRIAPYGMLSGHRRYLVAHDPQSSRAGAIKTYRMDAIVSAVLTDTFFTRPDDFEIQTFANRGFALYQHEREYEEIEWKFSPKVAENVMGTLFHPQQTEEVLPDGSIVIRFKAAGQLEMAWYLYQWGSSVEVLKPESLRMTVEGYQRSDFPALP